VSGYAKRQSQWDMDVLELQLAAEALRRDHPGCGVEKMYYILRPDFIGRDRFIELMMELGWRLKRPRNFRRTTFYAGNNYPNLIKGMEICSPSVLWQSDITYIALGEQFYYAVFIIDVYTKKIVGYHVSGSMRAIANIKALTMALKQNQAPLIHHSDRGSQYVCHDYTGILKKIHTRISMGVKAQDNAYAERINRTIKEEYIDRWKPKSYEDLKTKIGKAVHNYNYHRPHNHLNKMTPVGFENACRNDNSFCKPIITIFDDNKLLKPVNSI
jgi:transposase InsO family protein